MAEFVVPDVSAEHVLGVARLAAVRDAQSAAPVDRQSIARALNQSDEISRRALVAAEQLGFITNVGQGAFRFSGDLNVRHARKDELPLFLKKQLLEYPPFLIFVTELTLEFPPDEASAFTVAALEMTMPPAALLKTLRSWGLYCALLERDGKLIHPTFQPVKLLDLGFLRRLGAAMDDDAKVRTFVVQELGPALVADLSKHGLGGLPVALADALVRHESEPRRVGDPIGSMVETYCASLFPSPVQSNSLVDLGTKLEQAGVILTTHRNLLAGLAGVRHPASHGPDKKTQRPWTVTPKASLVGQLLALTALRSIHVWTKSGRQEI